MPAEADSEEVEDLALIEISRRPDGSDAVDLEVHAVDRRRQPNTRLQAERKDVIDDLEARLGGVVVHAGDIFEEVVAGLLYQRGGGADVLAGDLERQFAAIEFGVEQRLGQCSLDRLESRDCVPCSARTAALS